MRLLSAGESGQSGGNLLGQFSNQCALLFDKFVIVVAQRALQIDFVARNEVVVAVKDTPPGI